MNKDDGLDLTNLTADTINTNADYTDMGIDGTTNIHTDNYGYCPECGEEKLDMSMIFNSFPAMYQCHNCDAYVIDDVAHEYQEKKRREQLPLVEKMHTNEVNTAFNEQSTQFKINQILDILEEQGLLRTK